MSGEYWIAWGWAVLAAPFVGSFVGLLALRLPAGRPVAFVRSQCPRCGHGLAAADLLPLVSWLLRNGKCRYCAGTVSLYYPAVELSALAVAIWAIAVLPDPLLIWMSCLLGWALLGASIADARELVLPDIFVLPLIPAGVILHAWIGGDWISDQLLGAVAGFAFFGAVAIAYRALRGREGLGLGDAKLLAAAGAWVGWAGLPSVIFLAAMFGLLTAIAFRIAGRRIDRATELPFGPCLAMAFWLVWLYGPLVSY
jgi:leader peptidase (prepilin peptidase)/N-methyltransferase